MFFFHLLSCSKEALQLPLPDPAWHPCYDIPVRMLACGIRICFSLSFPNGFHFGGTVINQPDELFILLPAKSFPDIAKQAGVKNTFGGELL